MLQFLHLKPENYLSQKWKNGKGCTLEIAVDSRSPYRWRMSTADLLESGEFSNFVGYLRHLVLISGAARLTCDDDPPVLLSFPKPFSFSGDAFTLCEVLEPGQDLNVFCLEGSSRGGCYPTRFRKGEEIHFPLRGDEHFLFLVEGELEVFERNTQQQTTLMPKDTACFTRPPNMEFMDIKTVARLDSRAVWVVIHLIEEK